jgi:hypothetical protein
MRHDMVQVAVGQSAFENFSRVLNVGLQCGCGPGSEGKASLGLQAAFFAVKTPQFKSVFTPTQVKILALQPLAEHPRPLTSRGFVVACVKNFVARSPGQGETRVHGQDNCSNRRDRGAGRPSVQPSHPPLAKNSVANCQTKKLPNRSWQLPEVTS